MMVIQGGMPRCVGAADLSKLHQGYSPGGPQDQFSCARTNALLGNRWGKASIELTLTPVRIRVHRACRLVVGGAPCELTADGQARSQWRVLRVESGSEIRIKILPGGCRVYLSVRGGFKRDASATSATYEFAGAADSEFAARPSLLMPDVRWQPRLGRVRVLPGPEYCDAMLPALLQPWRIDSRSDSMGVRLTGPRLPLADGNILSSAVQDGTIQATTGGLIALLRNRGTLGGYPRIATVIDCDVDRLAQFRGGQVIRFEMVDHDTAVDLCKRHQNSIRSMFLQ